MMLTSSKHNKYSSSSVAQSDATEMDGDFYQKMLSDYDQVRKPHKPANSNLNKLDLLDSLNSNFTCPICLDLLENTMVTECLHRFCGECITKAIYTNKRECPTCRKKLISKRNLRPDPNMDALIRTIWPDRAEHDRLQTEQANKFKLCVEVQAMPKSMENGVKPRPKQQTHWRQYPLRSGGNGKRRPIVVEEEAVEEQVEKTSPASNNKENNTSPIAARKRGHPCKSPTPRGTTTSPIAKRMAGKMFSPPTTSNDSGIGAGTSSADSTLAVTKAPVVKTLEEELFGDFSSAESSQQEDWSEEESSTADEFQTSDSDVEPGIQTRAAKQQHRREEQYTFNNNGVTADDFLSSGEGEEQQPFLSSDSDDDWALCGSPPPAKRNKTMTGNSSTAMKLRQLDGRLPEIIRKRSQEQLKRKSQQHEEQQPNHGGQPLETAISALNLSEDSATPFSSPKQSNGRCFPLLPNKNCFAGMQEMSRELLVHCRVPLGWVTVQLRQLPVELGGGIASRTRINNVYQVRLPHKATIGELHSIFTAPNAHPYKNEAGLRGKLPEVHLLIQSPTKQLIELYGRDTICTVLGLAGRANFFDYPTIFFTTKEE